jgi:hypothetical protein
MTSKEIVRRVIGHDSPPRLAYHFSTGGDIRHAAMGRLVHPDESRREWGTYPELLAKVPEFGGEVCLDAYGNILGRLGGMTKGECVYGALQDGWALLDTWEFPALDPAHIDYLRSLRLGESEQYVLGSCPIGIFSALRDTRLMHNALMDVALEPERVEAFVAKAADRVAEMIGAARGLGFDGMILYDDWGTQDRTFISPAMFEELFRPGYARVAAACHAAGMQFFLHSCGYNYAFLPALVEAGVDVFQFDQLGLYGYEKMAAEYGDKATFYSPLDIQKTLPTGDRALIQSEALRICRAFTDAGGGLILKDYPSYEDIGVEEAWAAWARGVFLDNLKIQ